MGFFSDLLGEGQKKAAEEGIGFQRKVYKDLGPYRSVGKEAVNLMRDMYLRGTTPITESPGYQYRLEEGTRGLDRFLAARGLGKSGRAIRGAGRLMDQLASQEYDQGFNRMAALAGIGPSATTPGLQVGQSMGQLGMAGARARQSGYQDIANLTAGLAGLALG